MGLKEVQDHKYLFTSNNSNSVCLSLKKKYEIVCLLSGCAYVYAFFWANYPKMNLFVRPSRIVESGKDCGLRLTTRGDSDETRDSRVVEITKTGL